ncbi:autotransporter assembly complex protein TamA [Ferruginivarius sediminum]|uniref:autotransporter assembly complex protein TamA n=1 Tax=Ferruginivarius sediminum TaxID=2661937 RepID=UPI00137B731F|nr:autotransporter assembly complex family protein [Ferruginivarius sediminum]
MTFLSARFAAAVALALSATALGCFMTAIPAPAQNMEAPGTPPAGSDSETSAEEPAAEPRIPYETAIEGVEDDALLDILRRTSQLIALEEEQPRSVTGLRRRAEDDVERLLKALHSEGFYQATVDYRIDTGAEPARVTLDIKPGTVYLLAEVDIAYTRELPEDAKVPRSAGDLGLEYGMRARAPRILQAQRALLRQLENNGYPLAEVAERKALVDHGQTTMEVRWRIEPGPFLTFGAWNLEGLESVERDYIDGFRTWQEDEAFSQDQVADVRRELMETRLFASIGVERGEPRDGELPVTFRFKERAHRSIGFTARFSTSEGPSGTAFWEHRNFFRENETVRLSLNAGVIEQSVRTDLSKPRFLRPDQKLIANTELRRLDNDAFQEEALSSFLGLERQLNEAWSASAGGLAELTRDTDNEGQRTFVLFGTPLTLTRDTRNSLLDPTEGSRLAFETTPFIETVEDTQAFLRNVVAGSTYLALDSEERFVLASRARIGSIVGVETEQIPAGKRFYAGGGGSIRGFDFQTVGPLDDDNDPLGGRSLIELNAEVRVRVTDNVGIVPFIDAGNVYDEPMPDPSFKGEKKLRYAAGLGLRYFTGIGPVRLDVAFPLNPRDVDDTFEFYISLGQAF